MYIPVFCLELIDRPSCTHLASLDASICLLAKLTSAKPFTKMAFRLVQWTFAEMKGMTLCCNSMVYE